MNKYGKTSQKHFDTLDQRLQILLLTVLLRYDHSVTCGYRGEEEQNKMVAQGNSKLKYPNSKHNTIPSIAVDIQPYPYLCVEDLHYFIGYVKATADMLGIPIRLGRDWDGDKSSSNNWVDAFHIELDL